MSLANCGPQTKSNITFNFGKAAANLILIIISTTGVVGCVVQSPEPEVEDIVKVGRPTFNGLTSATISSAAQNYTLQGECDMNAKFTEYTQDLSTWTKITCTAGRFNIPLVISSYEEVWVRSSGKFSKTEASYARVRFALPPTSPSLVAVFSSKSAKSDKLGTGTQNVMASTFTEVGQNGSMKIQTLLPRMVYEP